MTADGGSDPDGSFSASLKQLQTCSVSTGVGHQSKARRLGVAPNCVNSSKFLKMRSVRTLTNSFISQRFVVRTSYHTKPKTPACPCWIRYSSDEVGCE